MLYRRLFNIAIACLALALSGCAAAAPSSPNLVQSRVQRVTESTTPTPTFIAPSADEIAALPNAIYSAVIPGLIPYREATPPNTPAAYTVATDAALYGADRTTPIARLSAKFLGGDTVVVPVEFDGDWALILTPSRQSLPSATGGTAPAQTAAWIRSNDLQLGAALIDRIQVSVSAQTLTILDGNGAVVSSFPVGVGTPSTPTPTGVTGYLQARYLDPTQGQSTYPIQLTSLHSTASDNPYGGNDGGLIGVHYEDTSRGQVSHGCVRLNANEIKVVNRLPLGTLISIVS